MRTVHSATTTDRPLRESLFDAARDELSSRSWSEVTMSDVAAAAGVSRQTLYNEFGSRERFTQALVLREADRFLGVVEGAMDAHRDDPQAALTASFTRFITLARADPLIRTVITGNSRALALITTQAQPLLERSTERLRGAITSRWPQVGERDAGLLAECLVRLAISHATLPAGSPGDTAASIAELLGPFIERTVALGSHDRSGAPPGSQVGRGFRSGHDS